MKKVGPKGLLHKVGLKKVVFFFLTVCVITVKGGRERERTDVWNVQGHLHTQRKNQINPAARSKCTTGFHALFKDKRTHNTSGEAGIINSLHQEGRVCARMPVRACSWTAGRLMMPSSLVVCCDDGSGVILWWDVGLLREAVAVTSTSSGSDAALQRTRLFASI